MRITLKYVSILLLFSFVISASSFATILTFDYSANNGQDVNEDYGDNVTDVLMGLLGYGVGPEGFTPHITADYFPANQVHTWGGGYNGLTNIIWSDTDDKFGVTLTAAAGYNVQLHKFDVGAYYAGTIDSIKVLGSDGVSELHSITDYSIIRGPGNHLEVAFATPLEDTSLTIEIDITGMNALNTGTGIGLDNITFGELHVVPLSGALIFMLSGLLGLLGLKTKQG